MILTLKFNLPEEYYEAQDAIRVNEIKSKLERVTSMWRFLEKNSWPENVKTADDMYEYMHYLFFERLED
ncbi:MAG TPA: hypothetical protein VHZ76_00865 [Gammaproteobacteria bacterium]|nr:hypothetical protein [Gammaproteobacteria bacterium]